MPTITLRPSGYVSGDSGWSYAHPSLAAGILSDEDDSTDFHNTTGNQSITLDLANPTVSDIGNVNTLTNTTRAKKSGKGICSFTVTIHESGTTHINAEAFSTTSTSYSNLVGAHTAVSFGASEANNLRVTITGTGNTQGFFAEFSLTLAYTLAGYSHDVCGLAAASINKINSLVTANIGKVNSLD